MKKILALIALVVVISASLSFGVARWVALQRRPLPVIRLHDAAWLKRELKLGTEQARTVEKLESEFKAQLDASCVAHCAARFALGDELMKPQPDTATCQALVEKMNSTQAEAERATLAHILKVRALLNDEQARRYSQTIHDQVCSMPMGAP